MHGNGRWCMCYLDTIRAIYNRNNLVFVVKAKIPASDKKICRNNFVLLKFSG